MFFGTFGCHRRATVVDGDGPRKRPKGLEAEQLSTPGPLISLADKDRKRMGGRGTVGGNKEVFPLYRRTLPGGPICRPSRTTQPFPTRPAGGRYRAPVVQAPSQQAGRGNKGMRQIFPVVGEGRGTHWEEAARSNAIYAPVTDADVRKPPHFPPASLFYAASFCCTLGCLQGSGISGKRKGGVAEARHVRTSAMLSAVPAESSSSRKKGEKKGRCPRSR